MNFHLIFENKISDYGLLIGSILILGCSAYYLYKNNYTANVNIPNNTEALNNENIQNIQNTHAIIDSDSESSTETLNTSNYNDWESACSSDFHGILDNVWIMPPFESQYLSKEAPLPDLDFNICSLYELKLFEFMSLYPNKIAENSLSEEELLEIIKLLNETDLKALWANDAIIGIINHLAFVEWLQYFNI